MRRSIFAIAVAFVLAATPAFSAQGGPKPRPTSSKPSAPKGTTTKVKPASGKTVKAPKGPSNVKVATSTTAKPVKSGKSVTKSAKASAKADAKTAKTQAKADAKTARADAKAAKDAKSASNTATATDTSSTGDTTAPGTGETVTLTPVQEKLQRNTKLAAKLKERLPAGIDPMEAALGFKNLGQFVAAVNVSNNLKLDFTELKTRMVDQKLSLGQSIQDLKATASPTVEAQRAEYDARVLIEATEAETSATATTTSTANETTTKTKKPKKSNKKAVGGAE
jgi:hypothetical protein